MTQQFILEKVMRKFMDRTEGEVRSDLNRIQKDFSRETRILEGEFTTFNTNGASLYFDFDDQVSVVKQVQVDGTVIDLLTGVYQIEIQS